MTETPQKYVIFNADDFGYSAGINRGIIDAHEYGVVTAATLIVNAPATLDAVAQAKAHPKLSVGLHVNFTNEAQTLIDLESREVCQAELWRQYTRFRELMGAKPTHLDSHQHVHRHPMRRLLFEELANAEGVPLRDRPPVTFKGGFYAQWEYGISEPEKVSLDALMNILTREIGDGVYEMACHPGYFDPALEAVYHEDRVSEVKTLTDPRLPRLIADLGIRLISYRDLASVTGGRNGH
jgi:predicted glycoside hydrolase/deacetylase ChbG (UPF0249 family)